MLVSPFYSYNATPYILARDLVGRLISNAIKFT